MNHEYEREALLEAVGVTEEDIKRIFDGMSIDQDGFFSVVDNLKDSGLQTLFASYFINKARTIFDQQEAKKQLKPREEKA